MLTQKQTITDGTRAIVQQSSTLTLGQMATTFVLGVVFWFVAAIGVKLGSSAGFFGPTASIITFAAALPICWLTMLFIKKVARLKAGQNLPGIAIGLMAATFCDGIALTWAPQLYGSESEMIVFGAAFILWGIWIFLLLGFLNDYRETNHTDQR